MGQNFNCECKTVEVLASDSKSPVKYDEDLNEYNLAAGDGKTFYRLYHCFFCGGKLPESKRGSLFTEPSVEEQKKIKELLGKTRSVQEAMTILGKPNETVDAPKNGAQDTLTYKKHHRYLTRWQTLDLTLREREDGTFDSAFMGKRKDRPKLVTKKARD